MSRSVLLILLILLVLLVLLVVLSNTAATEASNEYPTEVIIGVMLGEELENRNARHAVQLAVNWVNSQDAILPRTKIVPIFNTSSHMHTTFESIQQVSYLAAAGAVALIGPPSTTSVKASHPLAAGFGIPQVSPLATDPTLSLDNRIYPYLIKMSAPDTIQSQLLFDLFAELGWTRAVIIASRTDYGKNGIAEFQRLASRQNWQIESVEFFTPRQDDTLAQIERILRAIVRKGLRIVLLNCLAPSAKLVLHQAAADRMLRHDWAWVVTDGVTSMDGLYDSRFDVPRHLHGLLGTRPASGRGRRFRLLDELWRNRSRDTSLEGYMMRLFDSVLVVAYGLDALFRKQPRLQLPQFHANSCSSAHVRRWRHGQELLHFIQQVNVQGTMNPLNFTALRYPWFSEYDVVSLGAGGWNKVASWTRESRRLKLRDAADLRFFEGATVIPSDRATDLGDVKLRIVSILEAPFLSLRGADEVSEARDRTLATYAYKGLVVELIQQLRDVMHFDFEFRPVADGQYGSKRNGTWNGLVADVAYGRADIAVAPLTITFERQSDIEFTKPFMDLGLTVLMGKSVREVDIWSFIKPFELQLWMAVTGAFVVCAVLIAICSLASPFGYRGRFSQRWHEHEPNEDVRKERSQLRLYNSLWSTFGAWMQQGADVNPRCLSGRVVSAFWWFAVMVITATYTANLTAFLTVARLDSGVNSIEELAAQTAIKYGTVANSAVEAFFESQNTSPYVEMNNFMQAKNSNVRSAQEGIDLVKTTFDKDKTERYAFIFDSAPLEFASTKEPCQAVTVGQLFSRFNYGLALPKHSPYLEAFNLAVLKLRQNGKLERLQAKYIYSGPCAQEGGGASQAEDQISLDNMKGVFLFLAAGVVLSLVAIVVECCVASCRDANRGPINPAEPSSSLGCCEAFARRSQLCCSDCSDNLYVTMTCRPSRTSESFFSPSHRPPSPPPPSSARHRRRHPSRSANIAQPFVEHEAFFAACGRPSPLDGRNEYASRYAKSDNQRNRVFPNMQIGSHHEILQPPVFRDGSSALRYSSNNMNGSWSDDLGLQQPRKLQYPSSRESLAMTTAL